MPERFLHHDAGPLPVLGQVSLAYPCCNGLHDIRRRGQVKNMVSFFPEAFFEAIQLFAQFGIGCIRRKITREIDKFTGELLPTPVRRYLRIRRMS